MEQDRGGAVYKWVEATDSLSRGVLDWDSAAPPTSIWDPPPAGLLHHAPCCVQRVLPTLAVKRDGEPPGDAFLLVHDGVGADRLDTRSWRRRRSRVTHRSYSSAWSKVQGLTATRESFASTVCRLPRHVGGGRRNTKRIVLWPLLSFRRAR
jgi:hypothetical protein